MSKIETKKKTGNKSATKKPVDMKKSKTKKIPKEPPKTYIWD